MSFIEEKTHLQKLSNVQAKQKYVHVLTQTGEWQYDVTIGNVHLKVTSHCCGWRHVLEIIVGKLHTQNLDSGVLIYCKY